MLCADHGPCVFGAYNTIVTARAGKDLVSSLVSGMWSALVILVIIVFAVDLNKFIAALCRN